MLTFDFDAETLWLARDPKTGDSPGVMSQGRYGAKVGVPRLLSLLRAEGVRATFISPAGWSSTTQTRRAPSATPGTRSVTTATGTTGRIRPSPTRSAPP